MNFRHQLRLQAGVAAATVYRRRLTRVAFIGVTGSAGKTTTMELIAAALGSKLRGRKTPAQGNGLAVVAKTILRTTNKDAFSGRANGAHGQAADSGRHQTRLGPPHDLPDARVGRGETRASRRCRQRSHRGTQRRRSARDRDGGGLPQPDPDVRRPTGPLVTFTHGNGRQRDDVLNSETLAALSRPLLVVEDADHSRETTLAVLRFFHGQLQPGDWLIVEDGNLSSILPEIYPDYSSGPHLALQEFFRDHAADYRVAAEFCDLYAYNATTSSNGILERVAA
jgi:hypothetical protein